MTLLLSFTRKFQEGKTVSSSTRMCLLMIQMAGFIGSVVPVPCDRSDGRVGDGPDRLREAIRQKKKRASRSGRMP